MIIDMHTHLGSTCPWHKKAEFNINQKMFQSIYPDTSRSIEHAGVHFAEEMGEFSEAIWAYRSDRAKEEFGEVMLEAADYFSCILGVFNSMETDLAEVLAKSYSNNCHVCHKAPCECTYTAIKTYK